MARMWISALLLGSIAAGARAGEDSRSERCRRAIERHDADGGDHWVAWRACSETLLAVAEEDPRDPAAARALFWVVERGSAMHDTSSYGAATPNSELIGRAMRGLARDFADDARVGSLCLELTRIPSPLRDEFLGLVLATSRSREARGRACLALAEYLEMKRGAARALRGPIPEGLRKRLESEIYGPAYFAHLWGCDPDGLAAEADALLARTIREFGDVAYVRNVAGTSIGRRYEQLDSAAPRTLGEVATSHLGADVGRPAAEIEGRDAEGRPFRLGDYRGKVVVLTFSGNWCPPCRGRYPEERELVRAMQGRPFALLSVSTDESPDTLAESTRSGEITWRCWWDGRDGPICTRWHVQAFPTIFLIDPKGIIRDKNPAPGDLQHRVEELLREAGPG